MGFVKKWIVIIFMVTFSSIVKEIRACFTSQDFRPKLLKYGDDYFLDCSCDPESSSRDADLTWWGPDGSQIVMGPGSNARVFVEQEGGILRLTFPYLSKDLAGKYKCISKGNDGKQSMVSYTLDIYNPLYFIPQNLTMQYLVQGQDKLIYCSVIADGSPEIVWYKGRERIQPSNGEKYKLTEKGLLIKNVSKEDEGEYGCIATIENTDEYKEVTIKVQVMMAPKVTTVTASKESVVQGDSLLLTCEATGFPLPTYTWKKIYDSKKPVSWKSETMNQIKFKSVTMDDHGHYECTATNDFGSSTMNIFIQVSAPPKISAFNIYFSSQNDTDVPVENDNVSIACEAIGRPAPEVTINCEHLPVFLTQVYLNSSSSTNSYKELIIQNIDRYSQGTCNCTAKNSFGSTEKKEFLEVFHKPVFDSIDEDVWTYENTLVNLSCKHEAHPPATVQWRFLGEDVSNLVNKTWENAVYSYNETILTVYKPFEYGKYECIAINTIGNATKHFHLREGFAPARFDAKVNFSVTATSVTFDIENEVSRDAPPLIGYTATYDQLDFYERTKIHKNRTWALNVPYKIDNLMPDTMYRVKFAALNLAGPGDYGKYYDFKTLEKSAPEPPILEYGPDPIQISADNKILKLKYPEDNGDPIDYYHIRYCLENGECIDETVPPSTELDLHHLSPNTSYVVEIWAQNSVGNSTSKFLQIKLEAEEFKERWLSSEVIIGIAVIVVILCILLLDILLFLTVKKGMIANCVHKNNKKKKSQNMQSRDKKGLLKNNRESNDPKQPDNGHKEFEYNKSTGVITGKHSAV